jgi:hypothetical protein
MHIRSADRVTIRFANLKGENPMNSPHCKRISIIAAGTLVVLGTIALATAPRRAHAQPAHRDFDGGSAIVGTWRVQVQSYVCGTSTLVGLPFNSLLTFNLGDTFTGATTNPAFAPGQRGTDQGIWSYAGDHTYNAKDEAFLFFTTPPSPPANPGFQAGSQILTQTITMKGYDEFTSEATTEFFDTTGKSYRQGCATATAQRFQ